MMKNRCPVCKADALNLGIVFEDGSYFGACERCGLAQISPFPSANRLKNIYSRFGQSYPTDSIISSESDFSAIGRDRFNFVTRGLNLDSALKLCDIGSGYGLFLRHFMKSNWDAHGIEPSQVSVDFSTRKLGIPNIQNCGFHEAKFPPNVFDIVCSFHIIEHLRHPAELLAYARRLLKEDGRLFLATPDLCRIAPDLMQYYFLSHGLHLTLFTPKTIEALLGRCGFRIVQLEAEIDRPAETGSMILEVAKGEVQEMLFPEEAWYALDYTKKLKKMKRCLQKTFDQWATVGKRIAVYGGGIHTQALIDVLGEKGVSAIKVIVDDDPAKVRGEIKGIPITSFSEIDFHRIDSIVVSSIASETRILEKLRDLSWTKECYGIYRDILGKG